MGPSTIQDLLPCPNLYRVWTDYHKLSKFIMALSCTEDIFLKPIFLVSGIPDCLQTHYVPDINRKFMILLPLSPKFGDCKSRPQDPIYVVVKIKPKVHVNQALYLLRYNLNSEVLSHGLFPIAVMVSSTPCVYTCMFGINSLLEELQTKIVSLFYSNHPKMAENGVFWIWLCIKIA